MDILVSLLVLGVVVFIHELGHMLVAKRIGIEVLEFAVGMGPKLGGFKFSGTQYSIRLFPIGGYVKLAGMLDIIDEKVPKDKWFSSQSKMGRFLTLLGGPLFNVILGFLIIFLLFKIQGVPQFEPVIQSIIPNSPAASIDLRSGDRLLSINQNQIETAGDVKKEMASSNSSRDELELLREGRILYKTIEWNENQAVKTIGISMRQKDEFQKISIFKAFQLSSITTYKYVSLILSGLKQLITGNVALNELSGPVGIIQITSSSMDKGASFFFLMVAIISISLGVFNLMPIPLLDGGHIFFILLEALRGKKLERKTEEIISKVALCILIALMIFSVSNDVINWQDRVELFQEK